MYSLLIVDDEPTILKGMREKIDWPSYGFTQIAVESTYAGALETAILLQPSCCLIDVCLGREKGYELIEQLNNLGVKSNYIMMSGYEEFAYVKKALCCGALDYLLKPIEADVLDNAVGRVVVEYLGGVIPGQGKANIDPILRCAYEEFSPMVRKILMIVQAEYHTTLNLKSLAEKFRMNSAYLGQLFLMETKMKFS